MVYIPEQHKKYELLPRCRKNGGEVFEYSSKLLYQVNSCLPEGVLLDPYGYKSYEEFFETIEKYKRMYAKTEEIEEIFDQFKKVIEEMNQKENWSILRYIGESDDRLTSLKHGHIYYWPCSKAYPLYRGVIDEEEYTAYWYSTEPEDWEILEYPTGMAFQTLYEGGKEHVSRSEYQFVMQQVKTLFEK